MKKHDVDSALDPKSYIGMSCQLIDGAVQKTIAERKARGLSA